MTKNLIFKGEKEMKTKQLLVGLILITGLCLFGCNKLRTETTTTDKVTVCQDIVNGKEVRVMTIQSSHYYYNHQQSEIVKILDSVVNSNLYNIIEVKTSYTNSYLTSAVVVYSVGETCTDKHLKVKLIINDQYYYDQKQNDVKPRLDEIVNSGKYNIQSVNTIILQGYLVAAEVYYYE